MEKADKTEEVLDVLREAMKSGKRLGEIIHGAINLTEYQGSLFYMPNGMMLEAIQKFLTLKGG